MVAAVTIAKGTFPREHTGNPQLDRIQSEIARLRTIITACPFIAGALVEAEDLTTSPKLVAHRLGRAPRGVIVVKASPDAAIGLSAAQPADTATHVNVESSATATASLWFW